MERTLSASPVGGISLSPFDETNHGEETSGRCKCRGNHRIFPSGSASVFFSDTPPEERVNEPDVPEQVVQEKESSTPQKEKKTTARGQKDVLENENEYLVLFIRVAEMSVRSGKLVYVRKDYHDRILRIIQVIGKNVNCKRITRYAFSPG